MQNPSTVYLVSCVGQKQSQKCAARDLYVSSWFLKARQYAEASGNPWFILSAKYGLVPSDSVIEPYEQTLNKMGVGERRAWAKQVDRNLLEVLPQLTHVVFLAGERYREFLIGHLASRRVTASIPMAGLRIGEQLRWLSVRNQRVFDDNSPSRA